MVFEFSHFSAHSVSKKKLWNNKFGCFIFKVVFCAFTLFKDKKSRGEQEKNCEGVEFKNFMRDISFYPKVWFRWDQGTILYVLDM